MATTAIQPMHTNPFKNPSSHSSHLDNTKDDWEDWDVDSDDCSPAATSPGPLIDFGNGSGDGLGKSSRKSAGTRITQHRIVQIPRVKSRARQKAQNAKAGIKLVTDMSQFRQAGAQQRSMGAANKHKFADIAALQALEGNPSSSSVGSFAWLKKKPTNALNKRSSILNAEGNSTDLSPAARPIVIGLSVPSEDAGGHQVSPQTAVVETPMDVRSFSRRTGGKAPTPQQLRSVWSPDTEASDSPQSSRRAASSLYSQHPGLAGFNTASKAPPVPGFPATMNIKQAEGPQEQDDADSGSPYTPFEEDGSPVAVRKSQKLKMAATTPGSASSGTQGWWDHVTTPFTHQVNNPFKTQPQQSGSSSTSSPHEWWSGRDEKKGSSRASHLTIVTTPASVGGKGANVTGQASGPEPSGHSHTEKAVASVEEDQSSDAPPPYEYAKADSGGKGTYIQPYANSQSIPSPGPVTPGFQKMMNSQGGIKLADVPLTPSGVQPVPDAVLPDRAVGSYKTGDHFLDAPGRANKTERQRRRHEKEDVVARKVGGFWRGRGCVPEEGCFGRSGREGRKRRRICLGILGGVIAAIILAVVLVVVLTHRAMSSPAGGNAHSAPDSSSTPSPIVPSFWLNLTDFPPMPTGVLTVAGPKNSVAESGCFTDDTPSTAWSCALPKDDQDSVEPYKPNQPEFIFQIQFDNNTQALWKLADKAKDSGHNHDDFVTDEGFKPDPAPPSLEEMRFLGNTTDHIVSDRKEGEPTPFFISVIESVDKPVGPDMLTRRQGGAISGGGENGTDSSNIADSFPPPLLNPDGTGAPAPLFPHPVQQPIRLFDRNLPTEHYGFYTYFDKKIYMANSTGRDPADEDGGVPIADAHSLVTLAQTRFLIKIWTRFNSSTQLLHSDGDQSVNVTATPSVMPGSMPYPVTIIQDMHGGDLSKKADYSYGVLSNMTVDREDWNGITADIGFKGTLINSKNDADTSLGGVDGGTGGCKCEWVNYETA
ncbi:hypothetical protein F4777DRAFT_541952 [Nemania sp. FL0916]|nr:hypothetical protein F4777DRAFT_541952 [Nemania sp. FL0916]